MRSMGTHVENMADEFLKKSKDKLKELQAILSRIRSLQNGRGGDMFFKGLAKTFQCNPVIPPASYYQDFEEKYDPSDYQEVNEIMHPKFLLKTKFLGSVGGGGAGQKVKKEKA